MICILYRTSVPVQRCTLPFFIYQILNLSVTFSLIPGVLLGVRILDMGTSLCTIISCLNLPRLIWKIILTAFRQRRNRSVGTVTKQAGGQQMNHSGIYSMCKRLFSPPKHTNWLLEPIQPPVHCVTGVKLSQREALHSLSSRVEVKNEWTYNSTHPYFRGLYRNDFTLPSFDSWHSVGSYDYTYVEKVIDFVSTYIEDGSSRFSENLVNMILNSFVGQKTEIKIFTFVKSSYFALLLVSILIGMWRRVIRG